jgi:predicted phage terminase large subunit-like protein
MSTRLNNPKTGCKVIVMQRLHENDLSGHVLRQGGWDHLCLPAQFEKGRRSKTTLGNYDPRTEDGELLWKGRFGMKEIDELKVQLGEYGTSGQLQQRPSPAAGGIIKRDWFKLLSANDPLPKLMYVVQSYDTAFTEKTQNDPTACSTWGVFNHANGKSVVLLDCWKEHLGYPDLRKKMGEEYRSKYGDKDKTVDVVLIEEKGSGISLMQDLRRSGVPCHPYNPGRADKVTRVHSVAPLLESGLVYLPESKKNPGRAPSWTDAMMHELMIFPNGEHDDMVDSMTQALIYLRDTRMLNIDSNQSDDSYVPPKERSNPYAA